MDIVKITENGFAVMRGAVKCCLTKVFANGKFKFCGVIRMFARATVSVHAKGSISLGKGLKIGKNAMLTAQGGTITIGNGVGINRDVLINSHESVAIGDNTVIAPRVCIYDHDHLYDMDHGVNKKEFKTAPITIGNNVWIGANAVILRGTEIGDNCIVGAGSIVKGKYPAGTLIVQKRENAGGGYCIR